MPKATIIIPAYNAEKYIASTLESILNQTFSNFECIIIDDGSTDNTVSYAKKINDPRFQIISIENSGGPSVPRNIGLDCAKGEYIFIFDSDDLMHPQKIELSVAALDKYNGANFLFTNFSSINENDRVLKESFLDEYDTLWNIFPDGDRVQVEQINSGVLYSTILSANYIGTSSVVIRRSSLTESDRFSEDLKNGDDYLFWVRFSKKNNAVFINRKLHKYRIVKSGISGRGFLKRAPSMILGLSRILNDCEDYRLRKIVKNKMSIVYAGMAYSHYKQGNYALQIDSARESLKLKFSFKSIKYYLAGSLLLIFRKIKSIG
ncbi:glycosyltransferase family 2 protein [Cellvibrio polysaccharolyticus]|uniref:Glycosyltransferase family 2 protein n=1 Tax=Cellvibrio polysaccharolyticus TaxID=2082724 RepID=A0A928V2L6_9GAMM|nr:glycosyltransferase family 2 protein [Cellvibrio polysaccharolyticus]MBE8716030.1 glycosyltransferase family 2 protein [Cellvibrio polysaccharolyticus]